MSANFWSSAICRLVCITIRICSTTSLNIPNHRVELSTFWQQNWCMVSSNYNTLTTFCLDALLWISTHNLSLYIFNNLRFFRNIRFTLKHRSLFALFQRALHYIWGYALNIGLIDPSHFTSKIDFFKLIHFAHFNHHQTMPLLNPFAFKLFNSFYFLFCIGIWMKHFFNQMISICMDNYLLINCLNCYFCWFYLHFFNRHRQIWSCVHSFLLEETNLSLKLLSQVGLELFTVQNSLKAHIKSHIFIILIRKFSFHDEEFLVRILISSDFDVLDEPINFFLHIRHFQTFNNIVSSVLYFIEYLLSRSVFPQVSFHLGYLHGIVT